MLAPHPAAKLKVIISHGLPIVCGGLLSVLSQVPDCEVCVWNDALRQQYGSLRAAGAHVVLSDPDQGVCLLEDPADPNEGSLASAPRVIVVATGDKEAALRAAMGRGIAGCLSVACDRQDIIDTVRNVGANLRANPPSRAHPKALPHGGLAPHALHKGMCPHEREDFPENRSGGSRPHCQTLLFAFLESVQAEHGHHPAPVPVLATGAACRTDAARHEPAAGPDWPRGRLLRSESFHAPLLQNDGRNARGLLTPKLLKLAWAAFSNPPWPDLHGRRETMRSKREFVGQCAPPRYARMIKLMETIRKYDTCPLVQKRMLCHLRVARGTPWETRT